MKYQPEFAFLNYNLDKILSMLGKEFDSGSFINAFRSLFPNEYATAISKDASFRGFHTWVARWYLNGLADQGTSLSKKGQVRSRKSENQNTTRNNVWVKK